MQDPQYHWRVQVVSLKGLYSEQNLVSSRAGFTCWGFIRSVGELRPVSLSSLSVEVYGLISALVAMCVSLGEVAPWYLYSLKIRSWNVVVLVGVGGGRVVTAKLQDPQYKFSYVWVCPSLLVYLPYSVPSLVLEEASSPVPGDVVLAALFSSMNVQKTNTSNKYWFSICSQAPNCGSCRDTCREANADAQCQQTNQASPHWATTLCLKSIWTAAIVQSIGSIHSRIQEVNMNSHKWR